MDILSQAVIQGVLIGSTYGLIALSMGLIYNARAAALVGVNVRRTQLVVVALSAGILAVSASLLVSGRPIHPNESLHYTVVALMPFVLGGMGNLLSILVSGIIIGVAETVGNVYLNGSLGFAVPYVVFIAILVFRPQGLFGSRS